QTTSCASSPIATPSPSSRWTPNRSSSPRSTNGASKSTASPSPKPSRKAGNSDAEQECRKERSQEEEKRVPEVKEERRDCFQRGIVSALLFVVWRFVRSINV